MKHLLGALACLAVIACSAPVDTAKAKTAASLVSDAPAGHYTLDKSHASIVFRVSHLGFSHYTAGFSDYSATLDFDPANPAAMQFDGAVHVNSLTLNNPPPGFISDLLGKMWFDADKYPLITFHSTKVEPTGANTANVIGDFTMHGITKPLTLAVTFNGGYAGHEYEPNARIGFSATTTIKRSAYGISFGIPEPGSNMGVSDNVEVTLEAEFTGPAWTGAPKHKTD
jgi:polyisoprenoid-binding protein YceI